MKTANAIREAIVCTPADWSRCNYARQGGWPVGRAKVLNSLDVYVGACERASEQASPILGGSRHKSDRIFIDAKLAISSPVTIPELCISLGDSRSEVYPSRLFPPRSPTRSALFHAESFLPLSLPPPSPPPSHPPPLPPPPRPRRRFHSLSLPFLLFHVLRNPLGTLHVSSLSPNCHPLSGSLPSSPFLGWKRHLLVEREGGKRDDTLESDQSR